MTKRKTQEQFEEDIKLWGNGEYRVIGKYVNNKIKIGMRHVVCGNEYLVSPTNFQKGRRCPKCSLKVVIEAGHRNAKTSLKYSEEFKIRVSKDYILLNEYKNSSEKVLVKHKKCNHIYLVTPYAILKGSKCPNCSHNKKITTEWLSNYINQETSGEYELVGKYINKKHKITIYHHKCNRTYQANYIDFKYGKRCVCSKRSKGEEAIKLFLEELSINNTPQWREHTCKHVNKLSFDFLISENSFCIEYDGQQHFRNVPYWGGRKEKEIVIKRDIIKNQYCIDNNIPLLRIPYWEKENIESILSTALMHFDIIPEDDSYDYTLIKDWLVDSNWDHDAYIAKCPKNMKDAAKVLVEA